MSIITGGLSELKVADEEVQNLINQVRDELESKVGKRFTIYEAVSFKTQVVSGANYLIKIKIEVDIYIHVRLFCPLSQADAAPKLVKYQLNKSKDDEIVFF
ncbi:cystatin-A-like [Biomphalaria glabrata]|uniref:Cystatin-A-like n=1 Tax=Biomphalaria glabrata TaxID=6526 RepID=A0A9W3AFS7_BIOGL|nr:cystatin-A-like [Biomphalaria glabrata]